MKLISMSEIKLAFIGFGTVAQGCAEQLVLKKTQLSQDHNFEYRVVSISDTLKGSIQNNDGIDLSEALRLAKGGKKLDGQGIKGVVGLSSLESIRTSEADVVIEASWTNLKDGEPGLSHITSALQNDKDVVTSNKGPLALAYRRLVALAKAQGRHLRFESTVMSGTPIFSLKEFGLAGAKVTELRGILNGTTNYILTQMEQGMRYDEALKQAQKLGYAEANPEGDVEAYDPAAKVTILANALMNADVNYRDVEREGISEINPEVIRKASKKSERIKLVASASIGGDGKVKAAVRPTPVPYTSILAHVGGVMNALQISTDVQPDVTIIGPGAGGDSAGYGLLNDLLIVHKMRANGETMMS
jgi:homoserine dehydrogenase